MASYQDNLNISGERIATLERDLTETQLIAGSYLQEIERLTREVDARREAQLDTERDLNEANRLLAEALRRVKEAQPKWDADVARMKVLEEALTPPSDFAQVMQKAKTRAQFERMRLDGDGLIIRMYDILAAIAKSTEAKP